MATPAMSSGNAEEVAALISNYLASKNIPPTQAWLHSFVPTIRLNTPIVALQKTALFRILATDIQTSLLKSPSTCLPPGVSDPGTKERRLQGSIIVQLLEIEDIGRSRWSQVEAIEAQERGETTKGREVIRVVPDENANNGLDQTTTDEVKSSGPHKLLLQDVNGAQVYGMELIPVNGIGVQMSIGAKLVLKDAVVARGVVLLEPRCVEVLGGKVDAWDKKWREERKQRLKEKAGMRDGL